MKKLLKKKKIFNCISNCISVLFWGLILCDWVKSLILAINEKPLEKHTIVCSLIICIIVAIDSLLKEIVNFITEYKKLN